MKKENANPLMPEPAVIRERIAESADTFSLRLSLSSGAGFSFVPGQFNMLSIPGVGEAPFSFSTLAEAKNGFVHTVRIAGTFTGSLAKLNKGDRLFVRGPYGNGWPLHQVQGRNVIIVAGGIGAVPLRPVVYYLLKNKGKFRKVFLLYGAKTYADMLFKEEIRKWSDAISVFCSVDEPPTGSGAGNEPADIRHGIVTTLFEYLDVPMPDSVTFTCGPEIMMRFVARHLILKGQSPGDIFVSLERRMKCGIGHCGHCQIGPKYVCKDGPVFRYSDISGFADTLL